MPKNHSKKIRIQYYASLREACGVGEEFIKTQARSPKELFQDIQKRHRIQISFDSLKVAINDEFSPLDSLLKSEDTVIFIPPVAGG